MKPIIISLVFLLFILQYKLWFDENGIKRYWSLKSAITVQTKQDEELQARNKNIKAEIKDLKQGQEAVEERARHDLGMIKKGETFYQVVPADDKKPEF